MFKPWTIYLFFNMRKYIIEWVNVVLQQFIPSNLFLFPTKFYPSWSTIFILLSLLLLTELIVSLGLGFAIILDDKIDLILNGEPMLFIDLFSSFHFKMEIEHHPAEHHDHNHQQTSHANCPEEPGIGTYQYEGDIGTEVKFVQGMHIVNVENVLDLLPLV